jgi:hypothetical protein
VWRGVKTKPKRDAENADKRGRTRKFIPVFSAPISTRPRPIALRTGTDDGARVENEIENSLKFQWVILGVLQCFKLDVNIEFFPVKIPKMFAEIENLLDGRVFECRILLERNQEFTVIGQ